MIADLSMDRRLRRHDNIYSGAKPNQTVFFPRMHLISLLNITYNTTCNETDDLLNHNPPSIIFYTQSQLFIGIGRFIFISQFVFPL